MPTDPPKQPLAVRPRVDLRSRSILDSFRRGDREGVVAAFRAVHGDNLVDALEDLASFAIEIRRENVATIGSHEVFVRQSEHGTFEQIIAPVTLSLHDDTLYQIPVWGPYVRGTNEPWEEGRGVKEWIARVPKHSERKGTISAYGLNRVNKVAGCSIVQPPTVYVDGVERTNPYVERAPAQGGRPGDIVRIIVTVNVAGPAPSTGNPVLIQYTLDVDPGKDLVHMLLNARNDNADAIYLIDEVDWAEHRKEKDNPTSWKMLPLYGGVGLVHHLANKDVLKAYTKHVNILQNALKKAQTVARRNAMRAHPALSFQTIQVDERGNAVVAVVGWRSTGRAFDAYTRMLDRMARGQPVDMPEIDVVEVTEAYDAEKHGVTGDADTDARVDPDAPEAPPVDEEKNRLISQIDEGLSFLGPAQVAALKYEPATQGIDELRAILSKLNALVDAANAGGSEPASGGK